MFIDKIGVELEGGWNKIPPDVNEIGHDGSVMVIAKHVGEIASPPGKPKEILSWVLRNHPTAVNQTCGMHVHVSFRRILDYSRLADRDTSRKFLIRRLRQWGNKNKFGTVRPEHPFWDRLKGENRYCKAGWNPEEQISADSRVEERYQQMNFCWGLHRTMEVRVLPAFKIPEVSVDAIKCVLKAVEDYLRLMSKGRRERLVVSEMDDSSTGEMLVEDSGAVVSPGSLNLSFVDNV